MDHPSTIRFHGLCVLLAICLGFGLAHGQGVSSFAPGSSITQVSFVPDLERNGLRGIGITYKLTLGPMNTQGDMPIGILPAMELSASLLDENLHPVPASAGVNTYSKQGDCVERFHLSTGRLEAALRGDTVFLPYCAMDLEPGRNKVFVQLEVHEVAGHRSIARPQPVPYVMTKPQVRIVRLEMLRILTTSTNAAGESWDYKFFNPKDVAPDLQWSLRRGRDAVYESEKQKNDTIYTPEGQDRTDWFFISQGDKIQLVVFDFDLLGASDLIGNTEVDVDKGSYAAGVPYDFSFDQVRNLRIKLDAIVPPKVVVSSFQLIEGEKDRGVSGLRLQMEYDQQSRNRECDFILGLALRTGSGERILHAPRIIGPGAVPAGDGQLLLTAAKSPLQLFIPAYALSDNPDGAPQRIRLNLITKIDGQYLVVGRIDRGLQEDYSKVNDVVFGQWKVGVTEQSGAGGIRVSLDYEVPEGYFDPSQNNPVALVPDVTAPWGKVNNADWTVLGAEKAFWHDSLLSLPSQAAKGTMDLFLPFRKCKVSAAKPQVSAEYRCLLHVDGKPVTVGSRGFAAEVAMPALHNVRFSVHEAAVVRRQWLLSNPNLYWVLKVGETEVYRSPVKRETRDAKWPEEVETTVVVAESDHLQIVVMHKGNSGEGDRVLETWQGVLADLPDKPKGLTKLKPANLRRLVVRSYSSE